MRDFKGMKRQRSRNRSGGNGGNAGKPQQNANRAFESNGPDGVKIRGAAQHVFEKYQQLARDALTAGDRVLGESYQQHAEHYFRVLRAVQPNRPASDIIGRDAFASGFDIDFEDESGAEADTPTEGGDEGGERQEWRDGNRSENRSENRYERPREDRYRDDRPRDDRPREDRPRDDRPRDDRPRDRDRSFNRDDRPRDDRPREDRPRDDRNGGYNERVARDERPRDDRNGQGDRVARDERPAREDRPREDRPRGDRYRDRDRDRDRDRGDRVSDPLAVVEPQATPLTPEPDAAPSPVLRSHDGGVSEAPAFLQSRPAAAAAPEPAADGEVRPKVRRRRAPRSFDAGEGGDAEGTGKVGASEDA